MNAQLSTLLLAIAAVGLIGSLLQAAVLVGSRDHARKRHIPALAVSLIVAGAALFLWRWTDQPVPSRYAARFDAIRALRSDAPAVDLSLWMYDQGGTLLGHTFTEGTLTPRTHADRWLELEDSPPIPIPDAILGEEDTVILSIELNPNRFATPPDAVFPARLSLTTLPFDRANPQPLILRSEPQGSQRLVYFELRLLISRLHESDRADRSPP